MMHTSLLVLLLLALLVASDIITVRFDNPQVVYDGYVSFGALQPAGNVFENCGGFVNVGFNSTTVSLRFKGTSLGVNFVKDNAGCNATVILDGGAPQLVNNYGPGEKGGEPCETGTLEFDSLSQGDWHDVSITTPSNLGNQTCFLLFQSFVYTTLPKGGLSKGAIAGIVVGVLLGLILLLLLAFFLRRRRRRQLQQAAPAYTIDDPERHDALAEKALPDMPVDRGVALAHTQQAKGDPTPYENIRSASITNLAPASAAVTAPEIAPRDELTRYEDLPSRRLPDPPVPTPIIAAVTNSLSEEPRPLSEKSGGRRALPTPPGPTTSPSPTAIEVLHRLLDRNVGDEAIAAAIRLMEAEGSSTRGAGSGDWSRFSQLGSDGGRPEPAGTPLPPEYDFKGAR